MGRFRPILQPDAPPGIDPTTRCRYATKEEIAFAKYALRTLENERLVVSLAPAPDPHFDGHMIRVVDCRNPAWYRQFQARSRFWVKRPRIIRALQRVVNSGRVRGNGYERELLALFKELHDARRKSKAFR